MFCCRDDSEKFYSDEEILALMQQCSSLAKVERTDTTKEIKTKEIVANAEKYILQEIERYSKYEVIVTDRYHGTIFSIIFHIPLVLCKREGTNVDMNSRFETLFSKLGIDNKQLQNMMSDVQVNYFEIEKNIIAERAIFEKYLQKCLAKASE